VTHPAMWPSHAPPDYACPFCQLIVGAGAGGRASTADDVVYHDATATAFVASAWWPRNAGHVLVVPNQHYENVYVIPDDVLAAVQALGKRIAIALKERYGCSGTSFRQHNEPAGGPDVWHYHLHVFPRYAGDDLYGRNAERRQTTPDERLPYAATLRAYSGGHPAVPR
jgi:histidine triad (HIT) family protein